jgi:hypothetical protein
MLQLVENTRRNSIQFLHFFGIPITSEWNRSDKKVDDLLALNLRHIITPGGPPSIWLKPKGVDELLMFQFFIFNVYL